MITRPFTTLTLVAAAAILTDHTACCSPHDPSATQQQQRLSSTTLHLADIAAPHIAVQSPREAAVWEQRHWNLLSFSTDAAIVPKTYAQIWLARHVNETSFDLHTKLGQRNLRPDASFLESFYLAKLSLRSAGQTLQQESKVTSEAETQRPAGFWDWKWWRGPGNKNGDDEGDSPEEEEGRTPSKPSPPKPSPPTPDDQWRIVILNETGWWPWKDSDVLGVSAKFQVRLLDADGGGAEDQDNLLAGRQRPPRPPGSRSRLDF